VWTRVATGVVVAAFMLRAQQAELSGLISDRSKAIVPGAVVVLQNESTALTHSAISTDEGLYSFPFVTAGVYTIEVKKSGFQTARQTGVKLEVGQSARVDFTLEPGGLEQSVTVSAEGALVKTDSAAVSTVINRQFIENLPLNGRSFQSLIALTPGIVMTPATFGEQGQFSVNGQRANANYFTIDGVSANIGVSAGLTLVQSGSGSLPGLGATGGTNTLVSVEALEEFRVQTSGYAAEYGRMPGAQVTILTRSGTNQLHGSLFDFFRNDALDSNDWFAKANQLPKPELRQNDFGGAVGGPIRRNRTFYFFSYEGLRLRQPQVESTDVPSLYVRSLAGRSTLPFLAAFPIPNRPEARNTGFAPFVASFTNPSSLDATSLRIDHMMGTKLTLFGRYNHAPSDTTARLYALSNPIDTTANTDTLTLGTTLLLSPRLNSDLRFNYSYTTGSSYARLDTFGGGEPVTPEQFFPSFADAKNSFGIYSLLGGINSSYYLGKNVVNSQRQYNLVDSWSFITGSHQLKFGADYRRTATENNPRAYDLEASFVGVFAAVFGQTTQTVIDAQEDITVFFNNLSLFAQDTWKTTNRLTLTYGLRWELNPGPSGSKQLYTFEGYQDPHNIQIAPAGTPLYATTYHNFAPRIGAAYHLVQTPGRETTLRGGFGMFYDLGAGIITQAAAGFPYYRQKNFLQGTAWPLTGDAALPPPFTLKPPANSIYGAVNGLALPLTYQWNLTLERALGRSNALSVGYVGAAGRHLLRQDFFVNPNDNFTYAYLLTNKAFSNFDSLQVQFQRRLSYGLQALVSYTWGQSLDTASTDSGSHLAALQLNPHQDYGPSDFDIRHTLSGAFSYNIPGARKLVKGWALDGVITARTATPVDVTYYADIGFGAYNFRPDLVAGVPIYLADPNVAGGRRFNPDAFQTPNEFPGRQGTLGRNALRGFALDQVNFTIRREFPLRECLKLQFRAEMFNALNHPNFANPAGSLGSPQFGYSTQMLGQSLGRGGVNGGLNPLYQVGGPRSIQIALRVVF
jgi:outer membrane receptor protein involved in Fe transport